MDVLGVPYLRKVGKWEWIPCNGYKETALVLPSKTILSSDRRNVNRCNHYVLNRVDWQQNAGSMEPSQVTQVKTKNNFSVPLKNGICFSTWFTWCNRVIFALSISCYSSFSVCFWILFYCFEQWLCQSMKRVLPMKKRFWPFAGGPPDCAAMSDGQSHLRRANLLRSIGINALKIH